MKDDFIEKLDLLRGFVGFPLIVTSGYRCPKHNQAVSTTGPHGPHTTGRAVDLAVDRKNAFKLIKIMMHGAAGDFTGLGIKQTGSGRFIHLDDLAEPGHSPRPTVWGYP